MCESDSHQLQSWESTLTDTSFSKSKTDSQYSAFSDCSREECQDITVCESNYLWSSVCQHKRWISTSGHEAVMTSTVPFLQAMLITESFSEDCESWAESQQKMQLNSLMSKIWWRLADDLEKMKRQHDSDVKRNSVPQEAWRISISYQTINPSCWLWDSYMTQWVNVMHIWWNRFMTQSRITTLSVIRIALKNMCRLYCRGWSFWALTFIM